MLGALGMLDADRTTVRRLRLRCAGDADQVAAARVRLSLLAAALRPATFPPSAILCVRRLADPLPGRLSARASVRPPAEWEHAVRERLTRLWRDAARPALGPVPPDADAVLFADRGELLACFAADWSEGLLHARWWWSGERVATVPNAGRSPAAAAWIEHAESVPDALACLAESRRTSRVVAAFTDREAREISAAVAMRFALPALVEQRPQREVTAEVVADVARRD